MSPSTTLSINHHLKCYQAALFLEMFKQPRTAETFKLSMCSGQRSEVILLKEHSKGHALLFWKHSYITFTSLLTLWTWHGDLLKCCNETDLLDQVPAVVTLSEMQGTQLGWWLVNESRTGILSAAMGRSSEAGRGST